MPSKPIAPQMPACQPALSTRLQHDSYQAPAGFEALCPPLHRASTVLFPSVAAMRSRQWQDRSAYTYGLHGTPTTFTLEARLAAIEGARHVQLCPSGLAAIALVNLALLRQGDAVLLPSNAYGPGRDMAVSMLAGLGIETRVYDPLDLAATRALLDAKVKLMWLEAPGSVSLEMPDLPALVALAAEVGAVTALDNTWSAGIALQPFALGIDISMQALTKYQSGGADVLMGAVLTCDSELKQRLSDAHMHLGFGVGADDCALVLRGLPTLALRYAAHDRASRELAAWLQQQPQVAEVRHPALPDSPGHAHWRRDCTAAGGLLAFALQPHYTPRQHDALVDALRLFGIGYSWGGPRSLAVPYRMAGLRGQDWQGPHSLIRLAIGLEDVADLKADLAQALGRIDARD